VSLSIGKSDAKDPKEDGCPELKMISGCIVGLGKISSVHSCMHSKCLTNAMIAARAGVLLGSSLRTLWVAQVGNFTNGGLMSSAMFRESE
jgi:hypothetical protein